MTPEDRDLAIRAMLSEAGREGPEGMGAVAEVILNRASAGRYGGKSLRDVVLAKGQFEPFMPHVKGTANDPARFKAGSEEYEEAGFILDAVARGALPSLTNGATHFVAPKAQKALGREMPAWAKGAGRPIGNHTFFAPEGKAMFDPSEYDAISRSNPTSTTPPPGLPSGNTGLATMNSPMQYAGTGGNTGFDPLSPTRMSQQRPTGNMLGRMMGGDASRSPQNWADVFAGAGPQSPLLFRALSYGMSPSPPSSGGLAANASGGPGLPPPAPAMAAAGNSPAPAPASPPAMNLPSAPPDGGAAAGAPTNPMEMLKGLFRGLTPQPQQAEPPAAMAGMRADGGGAPGMGGMAGLLGSLFKGI